MAGYDSQQLLRALKAGAKIIADDGGQEVQHSARPTHRHGDHKPWIRVGDPDEVKFRLRPGQCHPVTQDGGPWEVGKLLTLERN